MMNSRRNATHIVAGLILVGWLNFFVSTAWAVSGLEKPNAGNPQVAPPTPTLEQPSGTGQSNPQLAPCHSPTVSPTATDRTALLDSLVIVQNGGTIGTGVIVSGQGHILTAAHLLNQAKTAAIYLNSGEVKVGRVLHRDTEQDIAIIQIPQATSHCLHIRPQLPNTGSPVYGVGFSTEHGGGFLFSKGQIQAYRQTYKPLSQPPTIYMQTGMDLRPGSSGGPLLDTEGRLIGIISWKRRAKPNQVDSYGTVVTGWLQRLSLVKNTRKPT